MPIRINPPLALPRSLDEIDAAFMTRVLRHAGVISPTNEVSSQVEQGVGMTAGYFSSIKKIRCSYREPTDAPRDFVAKAWPALEIAPKESIAAMFAKDIGGYRLPAQRFYPRPQVYLAGIDTASGAHVLVMEDANAFAEHKVHERELGLDDVMRMLPGLADVAAAWEGADQGEPAQTLGALGAALWASQENLAPFKAAMPGGAPLFDCMASQPGSPFGPVAALGARLGVHDICRHMTTRIDAFFDRARPENGATCTLAHGDLRGDNIFFCEPSARYPHGWLCIDYQQMFRGPVPSDLAHLMNSGSVLPEVYTGENHHRVLRAFHALFMERTRRYPDYSYAQFLDEYRMMSTVQHIYYIAFGAPLAQAGAFENTLGMRVELGGKGATEADLTPEERRQRMWWAKSMANIAASYGEFGVVERFMALPENHAGLGQWVELPEHLRGVLR